MNYNQVDLSVEVNPFLENLFWGKAGKNSVEILWKFVGKPVEGQLKAGENLAEGQRSPEQGQRVI